MIWFIFFQENQEFSGDDEGDVGDDDSSFPSNNEDALNSFLEKWQRELEISPKRDPVNKIKLQKSLNSSVSEDDTISIENKVSILKIFQLTGNYSQCIIKGKEFSIFSLFLIKI